MDRVEIDAYGLMHETVLASTWAHQAMIPDLMPSLLSDQLIHFLICHKDLAQAYP